ncbi:MAG TPA: cyclodeaminase/cyclohydrolase family protein [Verrucomicrobiae bacterium]|nr:cyclodeaminase/cyclohydrolase family protein [Verrucomicrobiae bacterium]
METLDDYLTRLAADSPTPGGGSAATIVAAAGASLVAMVARICAASPKYAAFRGELDGLVDRADTLRRELLAARLDDERGFQAVIEATALPKADAPQQRARAQALERALARAAQAPLNTIGLAVDVARLAVALLDIPNRNLASDIGCAAEFACAAVAACAYNVRINHRFMHDAATIAQQAGELPAYERESATLLSRTRTAVAALIAR